MSGARMLYGRPVALELEKQIRDDLAQLLDREYNLPVLVIVRVGVDERAVAYEHSITRVANRIGIHVRDVVLSETVTQHEIIAVVDALNVDPEVSGVIILQPLPQHLSKVEIADRLNPLKDVDGITTINGGRLFHDEGEILAPSTPAGGIELLRYYEIPVEGEHAVVVGRSPIVGKPMALMLLKQNATVTICHSRTSDIAAFTRSADILVAAAGTANLIRGNMVKPGATVIDFGVNYPDGKMVGDVERASVLRVAGAVSPVPGGAGRVTTMILMQNTMKAAYMQNRIRPV